MARPSQDNTTGAAGINGPVSYWHGMGNAFKKLLTYNFIKK